MLDRINSSLRNACARDVASRGTATSEALAEAVRDSAPADAAKLLYLSSLAISTNLNPLQGLTAEETAGYLCAPDRDLSHVNASLLTQLKDASWYLHRRTDGRWYYRDVKNVNSAIKDRAGIIIMNPDAPRKEVEAYLQQVFRPGRTADRQAGAGRLAYQRVAVFPTTDDIQKEISADEVLLVISQPHSQGLHSDERKYREGVEMDAFRSEFEDLIFTAPTMQWKDLMETVARRGDWYLVPPGGHESLKATAARTFGATRVRVTCASGRFRKKRRPSSYSSSLGQTTPVG
jgi:hypothetical protein